MAATKPPFRADHNGSLLRPQRLLDARRQHARGQLGRAGLMQVEDECIREAVALQEAAGLNAITDGEFRRAWWHIDFLSSLGGVEYRLIESATRFQDAEEQPPVAHVVGKIRHVRPIERANFAFLKGATRRTPKLCIPAPAMLHIRGGRPAIDASAYPDLAALWDDLAAAYRAEIADLAAAGCTYLQLVDVSVAYLCDPDFRANVKKRGEDPGRLLESYADMTNKALADRPAGLTVTTHVCRGNFRSTWAAQGGYEPVADIFFNKWNVDGYFLEFDTERAGGFEPLRFMPKGKKVVLGLVTTKFPDLEPKDTLKRRIDAAAKYVPLENICLSPQCGFSSTYHGNKVTVDDEKRKLALVVAVAREVWGEA
jgi:5-methyltetrahydropteroyltriglutamate--homocysteine methyltransferase